MLLFWLKMLKCCLMLMCCVMKEGVVIRKIGVEFGFIYADGDVWNISTSS